MNNNKRVKTGDTVSILISGAISSNHDNSVRIKGIVKDVRDRAIKVSNGSGNIWLPVNFLIKKKDAYNFHAYHLSSTFRPSQKQLETIQNMMVVSEKYNLN